MISNRLCTRLARQSSSLRIELVRLLSPAHKLFALHISTTRRTITCWKGPVYVASAAALHEQQQTEGGIEIRAASVRHAFTDSAGVEAAKTRDLIADELGPCARPPLSAHSPQKRLPAA